MKKSIVVLAVIGILLLFTTMIFAASESNPVNQERSVAEPQPASPVADLKINEVEIKWTPHVENKGLVLTISGPDGLYFRQEYAKGVELTLGLLDDVGAALPDGSYNYELYAIPVLSLEEERAMSTARDGDRAGLVAENGQVVAPEALTQSGYFMVDGGAFVLPLAYEDMGAYENVDAAPSRITQSSDSRAPEDQTIQDDLIVVGSACIGQDCVNGENFGFDTIRVKENNLRIKFEDTSTSASFPSNDWQLTANDSGNGGTNKFSIDDITGSKTPFTIEASAPSHSLYVDDAGRVGIGTSTPIVELHIPDGDTPTVRLEQDGSSGFTPQTWDIAGNETNFFIRDATNGSLLPFKIRPSAPTNSLYVDTDGDIGLGTASPSARLDVVGSAEINGDLTVTKASPPTLTFENSADGIVWTFGINEDGFLVIDFVDNPGEEFVLDDGGYLTTSGGTNRPQTEYMDEQQQRIDTLEARLAEMEALIAEIMKSQ